MRKAMRNIKTIGSIGSISTTSITHLAMRLLGVACGLGGALLLFSQVAAGNGYFRGSYHLSPAACYNGCLNGELTYYFRGGLWYTYSGGQWYYYDSCWHKWISLGGNGGASGGAIVSAGGW